MKSVILGTAGHVDHGKTALVQALTGINTDRWQEERERGITIDLGFAPFPSGSDDLEISVVDVPGHEDFVKNMLAGATGVDVLLLVVAADEGPMPQTREHLWIARLLGVKRGLVAISKSDLVESDWLDLVTDSVKDELERVFGVSDWPILTVSALTGEGVETLKQAIQRTAGSVRARLDDDLFRLPVDRAFSVRGVGTVVTGTVWSGRLDRGSEVSIRPGDGRARVRGVQVHGREAEGARAGQRAALALVGVDRGDVMRGAQLTTDAVWADTRYLDVQLFLLPDSQWPMRHWQRVRFHLGTSETLARVVLLESDRLQPGGRALAQLRLEEPVVARAGDRFVIRFYSPVTTVGGGVVVDPWAQRRGRLRGDDARRLGAMLEKQLGPRLRSVLERERSGVSELECAVRVGASPGEVAPELEQLAARGLARDVGGRWYDTEQLRGARRRLLELIEAEHARDSGARGVSLESLRSALAAPNQLVNAALADLEAQGAIRIEGSLAALADHVPTLTPDQQALASSARARIREARLSPPSVRELAEALGIRGDELLPVLKFLAERGELVGVTADLYYDSGAITDVEDRVRRFLGRGRAASPSELREALGVSRKYLIPLLEHLDATGLTQRTGEGRVLRAG